MNLVVSGMLFSIPAAAWLAFLVDLLVRGTLLLGTAALLTRLLRRHPAAVRSTLWTTTFILLIALPILSLLPVDGPAPLPQLDLPRLAVVQAPGPSPIEPPAIAAAPMESPIGPPSFPIAPATAPRSDDQPSRLWLWPVAVWLSGFLIMFARALLRLTAGRRVSRRALRTAAGPVPLLVESLARELDIRRRVTVGFSDRIAMPCVAGLFAPKLILPRHVLHLEQDKLRGVILHELAHVRRRDIARMLAAELVLALYWFNPLARFAVRRAELDMEMACDDIVCGLWHDVCGLRHDARDYARQLLLFARFALEDETRALGFARKPGLELRVENILHFSRRGTGDRLRRLCAPAMILIALPLLLLSTEAEQLRIDVPSESSRVSDSGESARVLNRNAPAQGGIRPKAFAAGSGKRWRRFELTAGDMLAASRLISASAAGDLGTIEHVLADNPHLINVQDDYGMTPVAQASWNDRLDVVDYLASRGANLEIKNSIGLTPLFCTIDRTRTAMAELLIRHGADLSVHGYRNRTLLHMAVRSGQIGIAEFLIDRGADVNARDAMGDTPYSLARHNNVAGVRRLLKTHGARTSV